MPVFIRKPAVSGKVAAYSNRELKRLLKSNLSLFFEVPESHAQQVLRQQLGYQEVPRELYDPDVD
jgi:hypothetical protein